MFQHIQSMKVLHYQLTLQKTANPELLKQGEGKGNT